MPKKIQQYKDCPFQRKLIEIYCSSKTSMVRTVLEFKKMNKESTWKIGELAAKEYLEGKNYEIIERNYRTKYAEIDLVAKKDNVLIFVEVRTKRSRIFVAPEESINYKKLKKLYWNANAYAAFKKWRGTYRIDAICIVLNPDNTVAELEHYEGI